MEERRLSDSAPTKDLLTIFKEKYGPEVKAREGLNSRHKCPNCSKNSLSCHITKGLVHCFHCDFSERVVGSPSAVAQPEVDKELHLKVSLAILEESTLEDSHRVYLSNRGIKDPDKFLIKSTNHSLDSKLRSKFTPEQLLNSGYYNKMTHDGSIIMSTCIAPRRIIIPHWHNDKVITLKTRVNPYDTFSNEPRYAAARGSKVGSYLWYKETGSDVIITEGELCAVSGCEAGYPTAGLPGMNTFASREMANQILHFTGYAERVFIVMDTDKDTFDNPYKLKISIYLSDLLGDKAAICYLDTKDSEETDLDSYISKKGKDNLKQELEHSWDNRKEIYDKLSHKLSTIE